MSIGSELFACNLYALMPHGEETIRRATETVLREARDEAEAQELLDALGLLPVPQ